MSIVQSRRMAETAAALDALSAAHAGIQQAGQAHDRFAAVVLAGGGVAATLGELLGGWVAGHNADGAPLATHGHAPAELPPSAPSGRLTGTSGVWIVAITAAGQRLGTLVLGGMPDLDDGQKRTIERAAVVCGLVLVLRLRTTEPEHRIGADLLVELLARDDPEPALLERARLLGLRTERHHIVLVCRGGRPLGLPLAAAATGTGRGLAGEHDGAVVALVPGADPSAVAARIARRFTPDVTVGAAGPVAPARGVARAYAEARRTAGALAVLGRTGEGAAVAELGFAGLVVADEPDVAAWVQDVLGPVADHDAARGTDLVGTLTAYFTRGASPRRAAQRLHVHTNTVAQRLERVAALLGADWSSPERALEIQLALRLRELSG